LTSITRFLSVQYMPEALVSHLVSHRWAVFDLT
jgi:hypothetical protein